MEAILKHVNEKLVNHNLILDNDAVEKEYQQVKSAWNGNLGLINKSIKFVIIGEATVCFDNYFYNPNADTTSFLNPNHFGCKTKPDLINFFNTNGVLVFDLYPLPLPTFIYDNVKFDCKNGEYLAALNNYYSELKKLINVNTKIIQRYSKLYSNKKKRCEWTVFMQNIGKKNDDYEPISSSHMGADQSKISEFLKLISDKNGKIDR